MKVPKPAPEALPQAKTLQARVLSGSATLLTGSAFAAVISFAYNVVVARFLGPADFGHATAIYTILILVSSVTLSFQIVSAKVVAQQGTLEAKGAAYRDYSRVAWLFGISAAVLLFIFQRGIADYLRVPSPLLVALIAAGVAFYVPLGSRRGYIQGAYSFRRLAGNLVLEGALRLGGSVALILMGFGVKGVIAANSAAVAIAYFAIAPKVRSHGKNPLNFRRASNELIVAIAFFSGVALINNSGIVLVKHYFPAVEAGVYAAVAMVGRVIFTFASAVVNGMFPIVAGTAKGERKSPQIVATSLLLVLGIGLLAALFLWLAPSSLWRVFLGSGFEVGGPNRLSYLMPIYAIMTTLYSLSAVLITYQMAYKVAGASWIQLGISGLVIAAICLVHGSLRQVIWVQFALMIVLLVVVGIPFLISFVNAVGESGVPADQPLRRLRRVSEDEVVAGYVKSEFDLTLFRKYQDQLRELVANPDFNNSRENAIRRALLLFRHRAQWSQLPAGIEWHEVEVRQSDLGKMRVFPRAQWIRLAWGDFSVPRILESLRSPTVKADTAFLAKIAILRRKIQNDPNACLGVVVMIGAREGGPFTVLDGNHRLVAAALDPPLKAGSLRFFCGISPRMTRCCWYKTNVITLFRYGISRVILATRSPEAELKSLLGVKIERSGSIPTSDMTEIKARSVNSHVGPQEDESMTTPTTSVPSVQVIKAPDHAGKKGEDKRYLSEIESGMAAYRPHIVLDCSTVRRFDKPLVRLLLCCLEEAMKRNGDLRLASVPPEARAILDAAGARRLFEIFDNVEEAMSSFQRVRWNRAAAPESISATAGLITADESVDG